MKYENDNVIDGFMLNLNVSYEDAKMIFRECLKWFWYCNQSETKGHRVIDQPLLIVDKMWHTFIPYTLDYSRFCRKYFNRYMHHAPTTREEKEQSAKLTKKEVMAIKKTQYELVYELLGKDTFIRWYHTFPEQYSMQKILELRKK